jgi:acyl-[acyl-carrier-protein]-phospholipid O-acyltransferase/long-chain-fatty-acid--[acyl-carrier-protein] ligase
MAAYNFMVFGGMLGVAGLFYLLGTLMKLPATWIFFIAGVVTLPIGWIIVRKLGYETTRFVAETLGSLMYRMRIEGQQNIPEEGGALLVSNHVSWADGLLIGLALKRKVRMVVYADYCRVWWLRWFWSIVRPIPIQPGQRSVVHSIREARKALEDGELVCIFPEGGLTRDGAMQEFQPGFLSLLKGNDAPVIPVHLGGMWGSIFSYEGGRFFWKLPRKWPYPMSVRFGRPIEKPEDVEEVRRAVVELGGEENPSQPEA